MFGDKKVKIKDTERSLISETVRTENGADIDGYIKKTNNAKSKLTGDFLFKKKDKKETSDKDDRPEVVNKEALA